MCVKMGLRNIIPRGNAMYTQIEENIYSIFVPLPDNPLKNLNAYFIRGEGGRNLLIDTGFRRDECREALLEGLSGLGARLEDTDICLTHLHSDHSGLAVEAAGERGLLFSGPSVIGKSTQAALWERHGARLLNGDRTVLGPGPAGWTAWGSPYAGSSRCFCSEQRTIGAIVVLEQAPADGVPQGAAAGWDESSAALLRAIESGEYGAISAEPLAQ